MAQITVIGGLGKDPELKGSRDGNKSFAKFSVAWSERQRDANGQWIDGPTQWIQVTAFGRLAQNVCQSLHKGDRVVVSGRIAPELWSSQQGESVVLALVADSVAPDLTFATVSVVKNEKGQQQQTRPQQNTGGFSGGFGGGDPWNSAPPAGGFDAQSDSEPPF